MAFVGKDVNNIVIGGAELYIRYQEGNLYWHNFSEIGYCKDVKIEFEPIVFPNEQGLFAVAYYDLTISGTLLQTAVGAGKEYENLKSFSGQRVDICLIKDGGDEYWTLHDYYFQIKNELAFNPASNRSIGFEIKKRVQKNNLPMAYDYDPYEHPQGSGTGGGGGAVG